MSPSAPRAAPGWPALSRSGTGRYDTNFALTSSTARIPERSCRAEEHFPMQPGHHGFIDALRGYAVLMVMAVHASQAATAWSGVGRQIIDQGARGVQLFFVASALTLAMTWHLRKDGIGPFYVRRLFRIAPMFWLAIAFFVWLEGMGPRYFAPQGIDFSHVALTALFLHGWKPETITSVVPGGWSIAVEMTFYLLFPLLVACVRGWKSSLLFFIGATAAASALFDLAWARRSSLWPGVSDDLASTFTHLWFPSQLPVFAIGLLLYFALRDGRGVLPRPLVSLLLLASLGCMVLLALYPTAPARVYLTTYTAYGWCFGVFAFCLGDGAGKWLANGPVRRLGRISFSAYLWHFAILGAMVRLARGGFDPLELLSEPKGFAFFAFFFPALVVLTSLCSACTYRWVEQPLVRVGNEWLKARSARAVAGPIQA